MRLLEPITAAVIVVVLRMLVSPVTGECGIRNRLKTLLLRHEQLITLGSAAAASLLTLLLPHDPLLRTVPAAVAIAAAVVIAVHDFRTMKIPDVILLILFACAVIRAGASGVIVPHAVVFAVASGILLPAAFLFAGLIGTGDFKYLAVTAALLGYPHILVAAEIALITASIAGIIYGVATRKGLRIRIPFGPFISLGLLAGLLFGNRILDLYYTIFL